MDTFQAQNVLGLSYGLTREEVHRALAWARTAKRGAELRARETKKPEPRRAQWDFARVPEPKDGRVFCAQCDRRVPIGQAETCSSPFCKAKVTA